MATAPAVVPAAKAGPRARAARQGVRRPRQAHHLQVVPVEIPTTTTGVEELVVKVGRMAVQMVLTVLATSIQVAAAVVGPGILGAEVDY